MITFASNVLSQNTIETIYTDVFKKENESRWRTSKQSWNKDLTENSVGTIVIFEIHEHCPSFQLIEGDIRKFMKNDEKISSITFTEWQPCSQLNRHNDADRAMGMTIYLNEEWNPQWGGFFCWEEGPTYKMVSPKYNHAVMNRGGTWHFVSVTSPLADIRKTIQISVLHNTSQ
jgi:hypothetical protein